MVEAWQLAECQQSEERREAREEDRQLKHDREEGRHGENVGRLGLHHGRVDHHLRGVSQGDGGEESGQASEEDKAQATQALTKFDMLTDEKERRRFIPPWASLQTVMGNILLNIRLRMDSS